MAKKTEISEIFENAQESQKTEEIESLTYQLECIANADLRMLFDEHGAFISPTDWPDEIAYGVRKVTPHGSGGFSVDFHDKRNAIDTLARLKGHYRDAEADANPLESSLSRVPREELIIIRDLLAELAELNAKDGKA